MVPFLSHQKQHLSILAELPHGCDNDMPIRFKQDTIDPSQSVKIFGVITDQGLRYRERVAGKADKALKAALALKRLHEPDLQACTNCS